MLRRLISTIRRKPAVVRDSIAFWTAVSITGLIALVWLVHIPARFGNVSLNELNINTAAVTNSFRDFEQQLPTVNNNASVDNNPLESSLPPSMQNQNQRDAANEALISSFRERRAGESSDGWSTATTATSTGGVQTTNEASATGTEPQNVPTTQRIRISTTSMESSSSSQDRGGI